MNRAHLPVGGSALLLGLVFALAGSFADNLLGGAAVVVVLQVVLWIAGGILMLAGAASTLALRSGQRAERSGGGLRPTLR
jgi:hypothetical protein